MVSDGRGIPFYSLAVHREELAGRQTTLELTLWYALGALRLDGQILRVVADRGFAKFDFIGTSPLYPYLHLVLRLKGSMILTWGTISGPLKEWPLYQGEVVRIEPAYLGKESTKSSRPCAWRTGTTQPIPSIWPARKRI